MGLSAIKINVLTVACSAFVAGCVSYQPRPLLPDAELDALRGTSLTAVTVRRAGTADTAGEPLHFDPSDGLDESEVVAVALQLNPDLRANRTKIGQSEAALISAGVWPNPQVGVGWRGGINGAAGYTLDADLLFELLRPGEHRARRNMASAQIEQAGAEALADEYRIVAEARQRWLTVLVAERSLDLLNAEHALRTRAAQLVRERRQLGEATDLDVSAASLEAAGVLRERNRAEAELETARRELNRTLGLPPDYALRLSDSSKPLDVIVYAEPADTELDRRLLAGRQELVARQAEYRRREEELRLAVLQQYPNLKLGPSFGTEPEGTYYLGVGASVELPLFDRSQGRIAEALAARDAARAEFVSVLHRLRADAFEARSQLRRARTELDEQERDVLPLLARAESLYEAAYKRRELSVLDWVTARQRALKARRDYLDSLARYRRSIITLEAATGTPMSTATAGSPPTTRTSTSPATTPAATGRPQ